MSVSLQEIIDSIESKYPGEISGAGESFGTMELIVSATHCLKILTHLYDENSLGFRFLVDLTGANYPDRKGEELEVVYHVLNMSSNQRLRIKARLPIDNPEIFTATQLFSGANWMERETYDFFGIIFIGHPNLIRILNVDEMDYFPMRKKYMLEEQTREDKDDEMFGRMDHKQKF